VRGRPSSRWRATAASATSRPSWYLTRSMVRGPRPAGGSTSYTGGFCRSLSPLASCLWPFTALGARSCTPVPWSPERPDSSPQ
jgi:hypothetical protein